MIILKYIWVVLLCVPFILSAQVWPGDVNDNGIANNVDLLWMGVVMGEEGPERSMSQQGFNWEDQNLSMPWSESFPNGVNMLLLIVTVTAKYVLTTIVLLK